MVRETFVDPHVIITRKIENEGSDCRITSSTASTSRIFKLDKPERPVVYLCVDVQSCRGNEATYIFSCLEKRSEHELLVLVP